MSMNGDVDEKTMTTIIERAIEESVQIQVMLIDSKAAELRESFRSTYDHLHEQLRDVKQKVDNIEKKLEESVDAAVWL